MKYIFLYVYIFFVKIIDSLKPFITKYVFAYESSYIIKSLSGLLENSNKQIVENSNKQIKHHSYINNKKQLEQSLSITNNNLNLEKEKIIIPGYMDHDPKAEVYKKRNQSSAVKSTTADGL
jgi:hypothetical protein